MSNKAPAAAPKPTASPILLLVIIAVVAVSGVIAWQFKPDMTNYDRAWVVSYSQAPGADGYPEEVLRGAVIQGERGEVFLRFREVRSGDAGFDPVRTDVLLVADPDGLDASDDGFQAWLRGGGAAVFVGEGTAALVALDPLAKALGLENVMPQPGAPGPLTVARDAGARHPLVADLPVSFPWPAGVRSGVGVAGDLPESADVLLRVGDRPVLVVARYGRGRLIWCGLDLEGGVAAETRNGLVARLLVWAANERMRADALRWRPEAG